MVRYDKEHKLATRRRITETAARRFKQDGIDGSGIAALMADAGLTNGAFYAHFASKEDLVANAIADELRIQNERLNALPPGRESLEAFVREYLSPAHRDARTTGCPSAALLDEVGRCAPETRKAYTEGASAIVDTIAAHISPADPRSARGPALGLYTLLVGTLQLSRALTDTSFSDEVLEQGIQNALTLLGRPH